MKLEDIITLIEQTGNQPRSYSGRGMYGSECLGVVVDDPIEFVLDLFWSMSALKVILSPNGDIHELDTDIEQLVDALRHSRTDSMGLSTILYWPRIKWEGSPSLDDDEDNE